MAEVSAALVKQLREKTGAGMMDCKRALGETEGDLEGAVDWLRKKGLAAAAKKAGRVAAEGLVGVAVEDRAGALVEVNSETDFVARNDNFQEFVRNVTQLALHGGEVSDLKQLAYYDKGHTVEAEMTHLIATIGENMTLRRAERLSVKEGVVASYMHSAAAPGLGKIGVLVALESSGDKAKLEALGKQLAMHVAAANPQWLSVAAVDPAALERERNVLIEQARAGGKPEDVIAKQVEGRIRKFYEEVALPEQLWIIDPKKRVKAVLEEAEKDVGAKIVCTGYVRYALGEGIEKAQSDFAAEVAQLAT